MKIPDHVKKEDRKFYDPRSPHYIPNFDELGLEDGDEVGMSQDEIDRLTRSFQLLHIEKLEMKKKAKLVQRQLDLCTHWYNMESHETIERALRNLAKKAKIIIEEINSKETLKAKYDSNNNLLYRVLFQDPKYRAAAPVNVARFPKKFINGEIIGSKSSILALWYFIYSLRR